MAEGWRTVAVKPMIEALAVKALLESCGFPVRLTGRDLVLAFLFGLYAWVEVEVQVPRERWAEAQEIIENGKAG